MSSWEALCMSCYETNVKHRRSKNDRRRGSFASQTLEDLPEFQTKEEEMEYRRRHEINQVFEMYATKYCQAKKLERQQVKLKEYNTLMRCLGMDPTPEEATAVIKKYDKDGNGALDKEEFMKMMLENWRVGDFQKVEIDAIFDTFHQDGSGLIERKEMEKFMVVLGNMTPDDFNDMMDRVDEDRDGSIGHHELHKLLWIDEEKMNIDMKDVPETKLIKNLGLRITMRDIKVFHPYVIESEKEWLLKKRQNRYKSLDPLASNDYDHGTHPNFIDEDEQQKI